MVSSYKYSIGWDMCKKWTTLGKFSFMILNTFSFPASHQHTKSKKKLMQNSD